MGPVRTDLRRRWLVPAAVVLAAVGMLAFGFEHIPEGSVGADGGGLRGPGWVFSPPWARLSTLPREGRVEVEGLELRTREGSTFHYALEAEYVVGETLAPTLVSDLRRLGFEGAVRRLAQAAIREAGAKLDAESLLVDPTLLEGAVQAALAAAGLVVPRLHLESDLQDEVLLRRRTDEARALARPMTGRLLVVGWDGADWEVIRPMLDTGQLPHLARIVREGASGDLRSYDPMFSPLLWTTVATGKPPDKHGIADFLVNDPSMGGRRPISSDFRKVKALWNVLGDFDRPSAWFAWWASYPAEPVLGINVTELVPFTLVRSGPDKTARKSGLAWPTDYLVARTHLLVPPASVPYEHVRSLFPIDPAAFRSAVERAPTDRPERTSKEPPDPAVFAVKLLSAMETTHSLALDAVRAKLPVVSVYYEGVDMMGHRFQHYLPPKMGLATQAEFERFRGAVPAYYRMQDRMLGELLEAAGPDTTTVLLSDHGFRSGADRPKDVPPYTTGQPAEWHRAWGILVLHGPRIRHASLRPASLYDVTPTLLYLFGLPLADDMPGKLVTEAFRPEELQRHPPTRIRSYELVGEPLRRGDVSPLDPEAMDEMMANLRALGYVGGGGEEADTGSAGAPLTAENAVETQVFYHRNLATYHIKQGAFREAEAELLAANRRQAFPKTYAMLAEVRAAQGRYREAALALEEGWRAIGNQMSPESLLWMYEMHLLSQDPARADAAARRFETRMTPALRLALEGRALEVHGDAGGAIRAYEQALRADPLLASIAVRLYNLYQAIGENDRIVPFLEHGLEVSPAVDLYHNLLGEIAKARGDLDEAARHFGKATALQPENGLYLGNLAAVEAARGRSREARQAIDWALRWDPKEPEAWIAIGGALDRLGDAQGALLAFRKAKERGASGPAADIGTALVLARAGRVREARQVLASARSRFPNSRAVKDLSTHLGAP